MCAACWLGWNGIGWTLAERAGDVSPDGMRRLFRKADWDAAHSRALALPPRLALVGHGFLMRSY